MQSSLQDIALAKENTFNVNNSLIAIIDDSQIPHIDNGMCPIRINAVLNWPSVDFHLLLWRKIDTRNFTQVCNNKARGRNTDCQILFCVKNNQTFLKFNKN